MEFSDTPTTASTHTHIHLEASATSTSSPTQFPLLQYTPRRGRAAPRNVPLSQAIIAFFFVSRLALLEFDATRHWKTARASNRPGARKVIDLSGMFISKRKPQNAHCCANHTRQDYPAKYKKRNPTTNCHHLPDALLNFGRGLFGQKSEWRHGPPPLFSSCNTSSLVQPT